MKCPQCHSENPDTQSFCGNCGTKLKSKKTIPDITKTLHSPTASVGKTIAGKYKILEEIGFDEVIQAGNGRQALEGLQRVGGFDIALVDWNMPEMNGYDFVRAVRQDKAFDGMLLMMVTTETEMSQVIKALDAGANEYVMKPFTKDVIVEKLELLGLLDGTECLEPAF